MSWLDFKWSCSVEALQEQQYFVILNVWRHTSKSKEYSLLQYQDSCDKKGSITLHEACIITVLYKLMQYHFWDLKKTKQQWTFCLNQFLKWQ